MHKVIKLQSINCFLQDIKAFSANKSMQEMQVFFVTPHPYLMGGLIAKEAFLKTFNQNKNKLPNGKIIYDSLDGAGLAIEATYLGFENILYRGNYPADLLETIKKINKNAKLYESFAQLLYAG